MNITERVAQAIWQNDSLRAADRYRKIPWREEGKSEQARFNGFATAAIDAFLAAAAEQGWHMRPDEATEMMTQAAWEERYMVRSALSNEGIYRVMLDKAPKFEVGE